MSISAINRRVFQKYDIALYAVLLVWIAIRVSNYALWALSIIVILLAAIRNHGKIPYTNMPGAFFVCGIVILGSMMGIIGIFGEGYTIWHFSRDLIRSTVFPLFWLATGIVIAKYKNATKVTFYKTMFFLCGFVSIVDVIISMPIRISNIQYGFAAFVGSYNSDKFMLAMGIVLSLVRPIENGRIYFNKILDAIFKISIFVNFALAFSRTAILLVICMLFPLLQKHWGLFFKVLFTIIVVVLLLQSFLPEVVSSFWYKIINSISEISNNHLWTSQNEVSSNWRGYEVYCEQQDFISQNALNQLLGKGFGSSISAGNYAFLVTSEDKLPYLHNGYYTILMKAGIVGVICNIMFYIANYWFTLSNNVSAFDKRLYWGIILSMVVSTWVVGGVLISYEIPVFTLSIMWLIQIERMTFGTNEK